MRSHTRGKSGAHNDCIVIAIEGACKEDHEGIRRSAVGIYFAAMSPFNQWGTTISNQQGPTDSSAIAIRQAELEACGHALDEVVRIKWKKFKENLRQVVIRTSSEYLYWVMMEISPQRMRYMSDLTTPPAVPNSLLRLVIGINEAITYLNEMGVEVLFWRVAKGQAWDMREADRLAHQALEQRPLRSIRDIRADTAPSSDSLDPLQFSPVAREQCESRVQPRNGMNATGLAQSIHQVEFSSPIQTRDQREPSSLLHPVETWHQDAARDQTNASRQVGMVNGRESTPDAGKRVDLSSPLLGKAMRAPSSSSDLQELRKFSRPVRVVSGTEDTPDLRGQKAHASSLNPSRKRNDAWRPKRFVNGREDTPHPMRSSSPDDSSSSFDPFGGT